MIIYYTDLDEKTYSRNFRKEFNFPDFNDRLITETIPENAKKIAALDAS